MSAQPVERRITKDSQLNAKALAAFMGFESSWVIRAVKKASTMESKRGIAASIFVGRYSTARKVEKWLDAHPDFVAADVLLNRRTVAEPLPNLGTSPILPNTRSK